MAGWWGAKWAVQMVEMMVESTAVQRVATMVV
jgi:hypothetical protein